MRSVRLAAVLLVASCSVGCFGEDTSLLFPSSSSSSSSSPPPDTNDLCTTKTLAPWSRKPLAVGGAVAFNEIMAHPAEDPALEWVEIRNPLAIPVDLSGFRIDGDIHYAFPSGTFIQGGGLLVVAADADLLAKAIGAPVAVGSYTGQLPDSSGAVQLWNNADRLLDAVRYSDDEPWPVLPGGSGASFAKRTPEAPSDVAESWTASARVGGTPGAANFAVPSAALPTLVFNEVAGAEADAFWVELTNLAATTVDVGGYTITSTKGATYALAPRSLAPGEILTLEQAELGFGADVKDKLFLFAPDPNDVLDGITIKNAPRGRSARGAWLYPNKATPGAPNVFVENDAIVIHEIMYHGPPVKAPDGSIVKSPLEWVELYNRSADPVDVGGFQLVDAIEYELPAGVVMPPGGALVIANSVKAMKAAYPDLAADRLVGDFKGGLADAGENLVLRDACGNPVDSVHYYDSGAWPSFADGGGSSLELRDPRADNAAPEAWAASDEASASAWQTITYEGAATSSSVGPDGAWQELVIGLLDEGVVLLDDIHVVVNPAGAGTELISDGTFEPGGAAPFRLLGNHRHSEVIVDPTDPANHALKLVATGPTEHMHNHVEATLAGGHVITNGATYRISLRAKWMGGSNQLSTRLYFNRLARTTELAVPPRHGTPGAPNSAAEANVGPTYSDLRHAPVAPKPNEPVVVSVVAADPDGLGDLTLWYAADGGAAKSAPMTSQGDGRFEGVVPGGPASSVVQFYVAGKDALGASSMFPARGPASRALWKVDDGSAATNGLHNVRIITTPADTDFLFKSINVMSNDPVGATVIEDEKEAYYDAGVRLKSSERGRNEVARVGFALRFPSARPFRGIYRSVMVDRSQGVNFGQREMLFNQAMNRAGSVTSHYNDLIQVLTPRPEHTGPAELQLARFGDLMLDNQFKDGGDGMLFEYELIYYPLTTESGSPQGYKLPQPDAVVGTGVHDLGDDKEAYRLNFIIKNNRSRDDYRGLIRFAKVFGKSGAAFNAEVGDVADVDAWLRAFAFATLSGAIDNYGDGSAHNADFYVRPTDGRVLYFPHDLDFYGGSPQSSIVKSGDLMKLIATPDRSRLFYGHLYDIVSSSYNGAYMAYWCDLLGKLLPGQDFAGYLQFIAARADWAMSSAPDSVLKAIPKVAFQITTNGGAPVAVAAPSVTLNGVGWVDVDEVRRAAPPEAVALTWLSQTTWQASVPVSCGVQALDLGALDRHGQPVGASSITVTRTGVGCP